MRLRRALPLMLLAGLSACGEANHEIADNHAAGDDLSPTNASVHAGSEIAPAPTPSPQVTMQDAFDRLGGVRIGASLAELQREGVAIHKREEPLEGSTCSYTKVDALPDVLIMLDGDKVARIDARSKDYPAIGGVRVGQSETEALKRLAGKATVEPHPYTGPQGHYLVVHPKDAPRGIIFETDGKTVENYRFGQWEQVQWIEGCS